MGLWILGRPAGLPVVVGYPARTPHPPGSRRPGQHSPVAIAEVSTVIDPYGPAANSHEWTEGPLDWLFDLLEPPEWHKEAKCRGMFQDGGENIFFPVRGEFEENVRAGRLQPVRRICADCPVREPCAEVGGVQPGFWGGMSQRQRRAMRKAQRAVA